MLTGLSQPGQSAHEAVQAILVHETDQQTLVVIAERSNDIIVNDIIVGWPIER